MKFCLIVCTFKRPRAVKLLIESVISQTLYPNEILIIDGSPDNMTKDALKDDSIIGLKYFRVDENNRGLTKQRNFGVSKVSDEMEIICFLDDDIVLKPLYFETLLYTYVEIPKAIGVGGYIIDDNIKWRKNKSNIKFNEFEYDGWVRKLGKRNLLRKKLNLLSDKPPGYMPEFSNGFSTGFLPPSGKTYPVEFFMGGVASYRRKLFKDISFSSFFEDYGLYEDMDFCLRAARYGTLYVNTGAKLDHYHEPGGRPNNFKYGKMVMRNGWYVWRIKYKKPKLKARFKWHCIAVLLTLVRLINIFTTNQKKEAFSESLGRIAGWGSLLINKPKHEV